jgi:hypothetical protein
MMSVAHHKCYAPSMLIAVEEAYKHQLQPCQGSVGDAPVMSLCSLLGNPRPKPTGVLEHCREGETK